MPNVSDLFGGSSSDSGLSTDYGTNYSPVSSYAQNTRPMSRPDVLPFSKETRNTVNSQFAFRSAQMGTGTFANTETAGLEIPSSLRNMGNE